MYMASMRTPSTAQRSHSYAQQIYIAMYMAGLPALHGSEPGQIRKEAATAILCKCRGLGSPPIFVFIPGRML